MKTNEKKSIQEFKTFTIKAKQLIVLKGGSSSNDNTDVTTDVVIIDIIEV